MASVVLAARARPCLLLRPSATPQIPIKLKLKLGAVNAAAPIDFRFNKNVLRWQIRERWRPVSASNYNPNPGGEGDSIEDSSGGDAAARGPPLLTILAGFLVLLLVFWVVGSILMWLISLIPSFSLPK